VSEEKVNGKNLAHWEVKEKYFPKAGTIEKKNSRFCFGMPSQICLRGTSDMLGTLYEMQRGS